MTNSNTSPLASLVGMNKRTAAARAFCKTGTDFKLQNTSFRNTNTYNFSVEGTDRLAMIVSDFTTGEILAAFHPINGDYLAQYNAWVRAQKAM